MKPPLFHVGQAVVCIADGWETEGPSIAKPKKNKIYIITRLVYGHAWNKKWWRFWERKVSALILAELPANSGWNAVGFAPIEEMPAEAYAELLEAFKPVTA